MSDIRDQIRAFSLSRAEGPDRAIIQVLYRMEDEINQRFFGGKLDPVVILITPPTSARANADAAEFSGFGCRQQMRIRPSVARGSHNAERPQGVKPFHRMVPGHALEDRERYLHDLALHESVHLWLNQIEDPRRHEHQGHGAAFTAECNRIGAMLGLDPVVSRRRQKDGARVGISSEWPFCVRPGGEHGAFYGGLWEFVAAEAADPVPGGDAFDYVAFLRHAWTDPRGTDEGRHAFLREFGLAEVTVAIMPDPSPGDRFVTANDDAANGSDGVIEGVVVPEGPSASVPVISARPDPVGVPRSEAPITSAPESGLRVWTYLFDREVWVENTVLRATAKRVYVRWHTLKGNDRVALDRDKLERDGQVRHLAIGNTFYTDVGRAAAAAAWATAEARCGGTEAPP